MRATPAQRIIRRILPAEKRSRYNVFVRWAAWRAIGSRPTPTHRLPHRVVVSITSYPPRFPTLALTLKCLLSQSIRPDGVVLWVAAEHHSKLPYKVLDLAGSGLDIRTCEDIRSFKKLVPQLRHDSGGAIVTADDDVFYHRHWLRDLLSEAGSKPKEVLCHRAHLVTFDDPTGEVAPYASWKLETGCTEPSILVFPTGAGGVYYPPGIFDPTVTDEAAFMRLCPDGDDIWFFFMAWRGGASFRKIGPARPHVTWNGSQHVALWKRNQEPSGNDSMLRAMIAAHGNPWTVEMEPRPAMVRHG